MKTTNQTTQSPNNGVRCIEGHDAYACPNCMNTGWLEFPDGYFEEQRKQKEDWERATAWLLKQKATVSAGIIACADTPDDTPF